MIKNKLDEIIKTYLGKYLDYDKDKIEYSLLQGKSILILGTKMFIFCLKRGIPHRHTLWGCQKELGSLAD